MELTFVNETRPAVDVLAAVWTAGDPFGDPAPNAIADWIDDYDRVLEGRIRKAMAAARFTWCDGQRLLVRAGGELPFGGLLLVGATPVEPRDWQGWRHVGRLIRLGLLEAEAHRPGLLIERIFPTGLAELSQGLFSASAPGDRKRFPSCLFTGGIAWTVHDRTAVKEAVTQIEAS